MYICFVKQIHDTIMHRVYLTAGELRRDLTKSHTTRLRDFANIYSFKKQ